MYLMDLQELQKILEQGLLNGYWSTSQFNAGVVNPIYPSVEFLNANPRFRVITFRDDIAYAKASQHNRERGII